jgi:glycosyltransferase involved in cell wall biosynthesis
MQKITKTVIHVYGGSPKKRGSLEEYFLLLTHRLRERGWRSLICYERLPTGELLQAFTDWWAALRAVRTTESRLDFSLIREFLGLFRREHPAVVNAHFGPTGINALIAARLAGIRKRVWTKHSLDAVSYRGDLPGYKRLLHTINYEAIWATDIVAVSRAVQNELATHFITAKVRQIYLGIDRRRFAGGRDDPGKRQDLGVPADRQVVACISQARREKGVEFLVRALARLKDEPYCPYVLIVGGGPLTGELAKLAEELKVSSFLKFCGVRNDVEDLLAMASFSVLPSLEEAAGLVIIESFAAGKPVIASRVGGIPELINDGVNGVLVQPGDAAGLAAAIAGLCTDLERLRRLSGGAQASAAQYDVTRGVEETMAIYGADDCRHEN